MIRSLSALLILLCAAPLAAQNAVVYDNALGPGFQNFSWAVVNLNNANPVHSPAASISYEPDAFQGLYFFSSTVRSFANFNGLRFWVHGGTAGNQNITLNFQLGQTVVHSRNLNLIVSGGNLAAGAWREAFLPFTGAGAPTGSFDGIILQDGTGGNQGVVYVDDVVIEGDPPPPPSPVAVNVNVAGTRRAIDPQIYSVNFGSNAQHQDLRYPSRRWGGNRTSRYNWQFDVDNTANDYFFQNIAASDSGVLPNDSSANRFIVSTKLYGGEALMSVPTIGWVAKDSRAKLWSFSQALYGAQTLDECRFYAPNPPVWCTVDSGNGLCVNGPNCQNGKIVGNNPLDTSKAAPASYAGDLVTHLRARHGTAASGGVRLYALDNEPMLWNSTHRDVHPIAPGYDEVWQRGRDRALAIKAVEPGAKIFGPVSWGWCDFWTSAADAALGNCFEGPDRTAHGGVPFVEWYLQRICAETGPGGVRLVDYLDLHYYPQYVSPQQIGLAGLDNDPVAGEQADMQARRMRSLREMYDPAYVSESWMGQTAYPIPNFLPRARAAINAHCPGVKLALTEYKWGPDNGITGAISQAELLAIFGREGVDYAARWVAPDVGSLAEHAFRMYLDFDGANSRVVGDSIPASSSAADAIGAYAVDQTAGKLFVLLFNRDTIARTINLSVAGANAVSYDAYRLSASGYSQVAAAVPVVGNALSLVDVGSYTAHLLVINKASVSNLMFANGFE